jgi:hypothetical protein
VLVLLLTLALVAGLAAWALSSLGQWLMVAVPLEPAQAIVVLGGGIPFLAMEVSREVFGLLNAWTGLPVRQGSR